MPLAASRSGQGVALAVMAHEAAQGFLDRGFLGAQAGEGHGFGEEGIVNVDVRAHGNPMCMERGRSRTVRC